MKILLADDHPMVREGLKLLLKRLDTDVIIIEAHDYPDAMRSALEHADLNLVVLDRSMPGMDSHGGLRALRQHIPDTPIVVVSASEDPAHVWQSLESGARGYIPKSCGKEVMFNALRLVLSGGTYLPPTLLKQPPLSASAKHAQKSALAASDIEVTAQSLGLTLRQLEVLAFLIRGKPNKKIAQDLDISEATVRTHVNAIFKALGVNNRTEAVHVAASLGLTAELEKRFLPS
jgi:DNA-binding NarL/FixJ family response regulator